MGTNPPHQPLGDDALQRPGDKVAFHPDIQQAVDGGKGAVGVDGGKDQVAGHGGPHGDLRRVPVAYLAHRDDIRVLAEHRPQDAGKGEAGFFVYLHLADPAHVVFHRVLQGDQVHLLAAQAVNNGVEGGGFAGAGGSHHQQHPLGGGVQQLAQLPQVFPQKANPLQGGKLRALPQQADHHLFPVDGWQGGDTQVQNLLADGGVGPAVLGDVLLGDVHPGHNLHPGNHRPLQLLGHGDDIAQHPVDAHPDGHALLPRLHMDIAGPLGGGPVDDGVHQADGRGGVRLLLVHRHALGGGGGVLAAQQVPAHILDGLHGPLVAVKVLHRPLHRGGGGDEGDDPAAAHRPHLLDGHKVQGVRHGDLDIAAAHPHRHHHVLFGDAFGQRLGHLRRDGVGVQVDELHPQLVHQGADKLFFGDEAVLLEHLPQALAAAGLELQRFLQLLLGDDSALYQQVPQADVFHGASPSVNRFRHRTKTPSSGVLAVISPFPSPTARWMVKPPWPQRTRSSRTW